MFTVRVIITVIISTILIISAASTITMMVKVVETPAVESVEPRQGIASPESRLLHFLVSFSAYGCHSQESQPALVLCWNSSVRT
jgi:cbb3-type cytochrome oxidase cytochrome c subunit